MVAMSVLPESPVWLKWKGRGADAVAASKRLLGGNLQGSAIEQAEETSQAEEEPLVAAFTNEVRIFSQIKVQSLFHPRRCHNQIVPPLEVTESLWRGRHLSEIEHSGETSCRADRESCLQDQASEADLRRRNSHRNLSGHGGSVIDVRKHIPLQIPLMIP